MLDKCVHYAVVPSRWGDGPKVEPTVRSRFARTRTTSTTTSRATGTSTWRRSQGMIERRSTISSGGPDKGILLARAFISNESLHTSPIGEMRGFDANPFAQAKIGVAYDTSTGQIGVYTHKSCANWGSQCLPSHPIRFVPDASAIPDNDISPYNYVSASVDGLGIITINVAALNGWSGFGEAIEDIFPPFFPWDMNVNPTSFGRIHGQVRFVPVADGPTRSACFPTSSPRGSSSLRPHRPLASGGGGDLSHRCTRPGLYRGPAVRPPWRTSVAVHR